MLQGFVCLFNSTSQVSFKPIDVLTLEASYMLMYTSQVRIH